MLLISRYFTQATEDRTLGLRGSIFGPRDMKLGLTMTSVALMSLFASASASGAIDVGVHDTRVPDARVHDTSVHDTVFSAYNSPFSKRLDSASLRPETRVLELRVPELRVPELGVPEILGEFRNSIIKTSVGDGDIVGDEVEYLSVREHLIHDLERTVVEVTADPGGLSGDTPHSEHHSCDLRATYVVCHAPLQSSEHSLPQHRLGIDIDFVSWLFKMRSEESDESSLSDSVTQPEIQEGASEDISTAATDQEKNNRAESRDLYLLGNGLGVTTARGLSLHEQLWPVAQEERAKLGKTVQNESAPRVDLPIGRVLALEFKLDIAIVALYDEDLSRAWTPIHSGDLSPIKPGEELMLLSSANTTEASKLYSAIVTKSIMGAPERQNDGAGEHQFDELRQTEHKVGFEMILMVGRPIGDNHLVLDGYATPIGFTRKISSSDNLFGVVLFSSLIEIFPQG